MQTDNDLIATGITKYSNASGNGCIIWSGTVRNSTKIPYLDIKQNNRMLGINVRKYLVGLQDSSICKASQIKVICGTERCVNVNHLQVVQRRIKHVTAKPELCGMSIVDYEDHNVCKKCTSLHERKCLRCDGMFKPGCGQSFVCSCCIKYYTDSNSYEFLGV